MDNPRIVCRFSCGAASAVATKLILNQYPPDRVVIYNAFIHEEHGDNRRFLRDCEEWFSHPIIVLMNRKYSGSTHEVWKSKGYIKGLMGAPCSKELKRDLLDSVSIPQDVQVLGFTADEEDRFDRYQDTHPGVEVICPLIDRRLYKSDVLAIIQNAGIEIPEMYKLGFNNANCIGCCKGGAGYWNKIRVVFPEEFYQIADIQEKIGEGAKFLRDRRTGERIFLRELDPTHGRMEDEPRIECGVFCEMAERELEGTLHA